jgi:CDGSH-type Zn-finger protein
MSDVKITPQNDGPYHVQGPFKIVTEGGRTIAVDGDETWLCRCGQSANKPFCDGTHTRIGFKSNLDAS